VVANVGDDIGFVAKKYQPGGHPNEKPQNYQLNTR